MAQAYELVIGEYRTPEPIRFVQSEGERLYDYVGSGLGFLKLMSPRLVRVLATRSYTGWDYFDTEVVLKSGSILRDYVGLVITGRAGPTDDSYSMPVPARPEWVRGWCFDPVSWDGSHVFTPTGSAGFFAIREVVDALAEARISNVSIKCAAAIDRLPSGTP